MGVGAPRLHCCWYYPAVCLPAEPPPPVWVGGRQQQQGGTRPNLHLFSCFFWISAKCRPASDTTAVNCLLLGPHSSFTWPYSQAYGVSLQKLPVQGCNLKRQGDEEDELLIIFEMHKSPEGIWQVVWVRGVSPVRVHTVSHSGEKVSHYNSVNQRLWVSQHNELHWQICPAIRWSEPIGFKVDLLATYGVRTSCKHNMWC